MKLLFTKLGKRSKDVEEVGAHLHINSSMTLGLCLAHQSNRVEVGRGSLSVPDPGPQTGPPKLPYNP